MTVTVITPPEPLLTVEEAKRACRYEDTDRDGEFEAWIAAAQATIDGPAGWLGRSIGEQTLEVTASHFDFGIRLPCPPILEVLSVKYDDPNGVERTLDPDAYRLDRTGTLQCALNGSWPSVRADCEAIRVQYRAGYEGPPAPLLQAVRVMVNLMAQFQVEPVNFHTHQTVVSLAHPYRVYAA
ncbi:hypothetical protein ASG40_11635 [Methylobacterium sp. Leaf399]|uniref:hypothetical protein n=1 Tax=Methylobacterium sp. Leaf399 TaxID=1736364 RepID=UPI0006FFE2EB|nr:hypothetical protein [Methylobacterium sp. Leaf399]KQT08523.1 hypothetical protein ASG40_11635 [Methylobacterium sp. Leaf399]